MRFPLETKPHSSLLAHLPGISNLGGTSSTFWEIFSRLSFHRDSRNTV